MCIGTCYTCSVEYWKFLIGPLRIHREKSVKIVGIIMTMKVHDMYMGMWYTCSVENWTQRCPAWIIR